MQDWQKQHPLALLSVRRQTDNRRTLWNSAPFRMKGITYELAVTASWGDPCGNGANRFYVSYRVVVEGTDRESEYQSWGDVPKTVRDTMPKSISDLKKWNGVHSAGPWCYIENTLYMAGNRDHHGLLKGERRQIRNGRTGQPSWRLAFVDSKGEETEKPKQYLDSGERPTTDVSIAYIPWERIGEGKERQLDAARDTAVWPDATDEELCASDLETRLRDRFDAMLTEFHKVVTGLGFTW